LREKKNFITTKKHTCNIHERELEKKEKEKKGERQPLSFLLLFFLFISSREIPKFF